MTKITSWKHLLGGSTLAVLVALLSGTTAAQAQTAPTPATPATPATGAAGQSEARDTAGMAAGSAATKGQTAGTSGGPASTGMMGKEDRRMVIDLAKANMAEIEAAQMAQGKSQNEQVKSFAQQMINDHTKALQEVQQIAQAKGVTLPTEPDAKHKALAARMAALTGDEFDRRYMEQSGVKDHKATHALLRKIQSRAKDADLKALAARMQPTVDQHLANVQQLNTSMKSSTRAGSSGTSGSTGSGAEKGSPGTPGSGTPGTMPGSSGSKSGTSGNSGTSGTSGNSGTPAPAGSKPDSATKGQ
jgi:putative membrane protein